VRSVERRNVSTPLYLVECGYSGVCILATDPHSGYAAEIVR